MADKPAAEKTEQPTPRRLQKAREEGQVPQSQELASAFTLVTLLLASAALGPALFRCCKEKMEAGLGGQGSGVGLADPRSLTSDPSVFADARSFARFVNENTVDMFVAILPILAALAAAGVLAGAVVGGLTFAPEALRPKWNAINPATAVQNLLDKRTLVRLLVSILKLLFVGVIVWLYLRDKLPVLAALRWAGSAQIIGTTGKIILGLGLRVGVAVLLIGLADALYQKWQHLQELKMTRQEVRQEHKDLEGAPEIKARIRRIQVEMSLRRLKRDVPKASVILVNPTHVAVALHYEARTMDAPVLLAKGADLMAERIVQIGRSYGVPIVRRPAVARAIYATVKPGQPIPQALYLAVAEVLALLYRLRQQKRSRARS
jgi:flagellar biosynthetic protein FlhB